MLAHAHHSFLCFLLFILSDPCRVLYFYGYPCLILPTTLSQLLVFLSNSLEAWHCCPAPPSTAASYRSRDAETVLCYYCTDKPSLASIMAARDPPRLPVLEHPRNRWRGPGVSLSFSYLSLLCHSLFLAVSNLPLRSLLVEARDSPSTLAFLLQAHAAQKCPPSDDGRFPVISCVGNCGVQRLEWDCVDVGFSVLLPLAFLPPFLPLFLSCGNVSLYPEPTRSHLRCSTVRRLPAQ